MLNFLNLNTVEMAVVAEAPAKTINVKQFIAKMKKTITSTKVSKRYIYVLENLYGSAGEVYSREVYNNYKDLVRHGLYNYEIPYQIADADEMATYFDNSGTLCQDFCNYFRRQPGFDPEDYPHQHRMDLAAYMVCDMLSKGEDYYLIYDYSIVVRRTTQKQLDKLKAKELRLGHSVQESIYFQTQ